MPAPHEDQPSWARPGPGHGLPPARPNPSLYSHRNMRLLYTPLVIGFSHPWMWGVANSAIRDLYRTHTAPAHVEVGPGNAHWLRRLGPRRVDLIDLNRTCLRISYDRLDRQGWNVRVHEQSATTPWPLEEESAGSVGSSMLLHCLPGTGFGDKLAFFTEAHRVLHPGGRLFGATVLGRNDPAPISRLGTRMRAAYNRTGAFTNPGDTGADLHQVLERVFGPGQATVRVQGVTALFEATR